MNRFSHTILAALTLILLGTPSGLRAQEPSADEYVVKSAFLYSFAMFVEWPVESFPANRASLDICLIGNAPFGRALETISAKTVSERRVNVQRIDSIKAISTCHILFVSESESERLKPILASARQNHVLTVSDMGSFNSAGGMIGLFTAGENIRFSINEDAAHQAGLKISSRLLRLAVENK